jgi:hypothetical protein
VIRKAFAALLVLTLAACGGSAHTIAAKNLGRLALRQQDLGAPFAAFYSGTQTHLDNQGARSDPERWGREGGWIARYNRPGSYKTKGPLVVESRVDVFKSTGGAKKDIAAYRTLLAAADATGGRILSPKVGDEAVGVTFVQSGAKPVRFYRLAWRYRNATASITANGFEGKFALGDALALARKQQHRLSQA